MEKQTWVRPQAVVETFMANEYIASQCDTEEKYKFVCDAANGLGFEVGEVWAENGKEAGLQRWGENEDDYVGTYRKACGATYESSNEDDFKTGYLASPLFKVPADVVIWVDEKNKIHCASSLVTEVTKS